jgi:hypothetical protein
MEPTRPKIYKLKITAVLSPKLFQAKYKHWVLEDCSLDGSYSSETVTIYVPGYHRPGIYEDDVLEEFLDTILVGNTFDVYVYAKHKDDYVGRIYLDSDALDEFYLGYTDDDIDRKIDTLYYGGTNRNDLTKFLIQNKFVSPKTVYREISDNCSECRSVIYKGKRHLKFKTCTNDHIGMLCECGSFKCWECNDCGEVEYIQNEDIMKIIPLNKR